MHVRALLVPLRISRYSSPLGEPQGFSQGMLAKTQALLHLGVCGVGSVVHLEVQFPTPCAQLPALLVLNCLEELTGGTHLDPKPRVITIQ